MEIFAEFTFEAAHVLERLPPEHPCARMHGHSYRVAVGVEGPVGEESGWVVDFAVVHAACEPLRQRLDHHLLNEIEGLQNPTAENLARWLWAQLQPALPGLCRVEVRETPFTGCVYRGT